MFAHIEAQIHIDRIVKHIVDLSANNEDLYNGMSSYSFADYVVDHIGNLNLKMSTFIVGNSLNVQKALLTMSINKDIEIRAAIGGIMSVTEHLLDYYRESENFDVKPAASDIIRKYEITDEDLKNSLYFLF